MLADAVDVQCWSLEKRTGLSRRSRLASPALLSRSKSLQTSPVAKRSTSIQKLDDCHHFHYPYVELGPIEVELLSECPPHLEIDCDPDSRWHIRVSSNGRKWSLWRAFSEIMAFDRQLHRCVFDRRHSRLPELEMPLSRGEAFEELKSYTARLSQLTGSLITCYPVLKFLELDSRGERFMPAEQTPINTPAIAAARVTKNFLATNDEQLSIRVGDIVSLIEMAPAQPGQVAWWKAKLTICANHRKSSIGSSGESTPPVQVGYFPSDCVQLFDEKCVLNGSSASSSSASSSSRVVTSHSTPNFITDGARRMRLLLRKTSRSNHAIFGIDLSEHLQSTSTQVPTILEKCVDAIETSGIVTGIYRQCGIQSNIQRLRAEFDAGLAPDLSDFAILRDIYCVSSLLKQYFRQLPDPLFTFALYTQFLRANETPDEAERLENVKAVLEELPEAHYRTAKFLFLHLQRLSQKTELTDMTSKNLAIVWAPNLFRCPPMSNGCESNALNGLHAHTSLCNFIIVHADRLFAESELSRRISSSLQRSNSERSKVSGNWHAKRRDDEMQRSWIPISNGELADNHAIHDGFHTVIDNVPKSISRWKRFFRGPSTEGIFSGFRNRKTMSLRDRQRAPEEVTWRRSESADVAAIRASRSGSLISMVTRGMDDIREGVVSSIRRRARSLRPCSRPPPSPLAVHSRPDPPSSGMQESVTTVSSRVSHFSHSSTAVPPSPILHVIPSSPNPPEADEVPVNSGSTPVPTALAVMTETDETTESGARKQRRHVVFDQNLCEEREYRRTPAMLERSSPVEEWSSSASSESLHLEMSRYDNVSPSHRSRENTSCENLAATPDSFYDQPQQTSRTSNGSNIEVFYL